MNRVHALTFQLHSRAGLPKKIFHTPETTPMNPSPTLFVSLKLARLSSAVLLTLSTAAQAVTGGGAPICNAGGGLCEVPTTVTTPGIVANRHATQAFAGVNWTFGVGPELVAGLRYTRTNSHQRIGGARLEAVFPFDTTAKTIGFDRLRLRYIGGRRSGMHELGGGYSFSGQGVLASAALQAEHVHVGTDLIFSGMTWLPYVGFETLTKPRRAEASGGSSVTTCPNAYTLRDVSTLTSIVVNPENQANGQTCYRPAGRT
jgi:hypothetical protein